MTSALYTEENTHTCANPPNDVPRGYKCYSSVCIPSFYLASCISCLVDSLWGSPEIDISFSVQFSGEELKELRDGGAWENPTFDNMDQLMDER